MSDNKARVFVTSAGVEIQLRSVSRSLITEVMASVETPSPPMSHTTVELPGQDPYVEDHVMSDGSEAENDEDRKAWADYQAALQNANRTRSERFIKTLLLPGIDIQLPADDRWERLQKFLGVNVPQEEFARAYHYLTTELLVTDDDTIGIISAILRLSSVQEEDIAKMESLFRDSVRSAQRPAAKDSAT